MGASGVYGIETQHGAAHQLLDEVPCLPIAAVLIARTLRRSLCCRIAPPLVPQNPTPYTGQTRFLSAFEISADEALLQITEFQIFQILPIQPESMSDAWLKGH